VHQPEKKRGNFQKACGKQQPRCLQLHHCINIFLVLRDHGVYMYVVYIWKWSSAYALGASVVWHHSLLLMNGFNKTEAAVFSCRLCFLRAFPFISLLFQLVIMGKESNHLTRPKAYEKLFFKLTQRTRKILLHNDVVQDDSVSHHTSTKHRLF